MTRWLYTRAWPRQMLRVTLLLAGAASDDAPHVCPATLDLGKRHGCTLHTPISTPPFPPADIFLGMEAPVAACRSRALHAACMCAYRPPPNNACRAHRFPFSSFVPPRLVDLSARSFVHGCFHITNYPHVSFLLTGAHTASQSVLVMFTCTTRVERNPVGTDDGVLPRPSSTFPAVTPGVRQCRYILSGYLSLRPYATS
jgi:hypothetical protein